MICYEHPLNNKVRTWLRFSNLYNRLLGAVNSECHDWDYFAFKALFELLEMTENSDARGDLLMELDRFHQFLQTLAHNPNVDQDKWDDLVKRLSQVSLDLRASPSRPAHILCSNPWVANVRLRMNAAGGCNDFDVPSFHWWRQQDSKRKNDDLNQFRLLYAPYYQAISTMLDNIRETAEAENYTMINGNTILHLTNSRPVVLIRFELPDDCHFFPETSANRHIVNVRMMEFAEDSWEVQKVTQNGNIRILQYTMPSSI